VEDLFVCLDREGVLDKKGRLFIVAVVDKYTKLGDRYTLLRGGGCASDGRRAHPESGAVAH
jgi:hypothetical protein